MMPVEYFPPQKERTKRPPLPQEPIGPWAALWLDAMWAASPMRYERMGANRLTERAREKEERASAQLQTLMHQLEATAGPVPSDPVAAMQFRAPLANQARELVMDDLLSEFRPTPDAPRA